MSLVGMMSRATWAGIFASVSLTLVSPSWAQTDDQIAAARAAADAGANSFEAGNWEKAIGYFERAEALVHSPVHLWYIAQASAKLGRLVVAKERCVKVRREGLPEGASSGRIAAYEGCESLIREIEGRLASLTIEVSGLPDDAEFEVLRNGAKVPSAIVGVPAPIDPGTYTLAGRANGFKADELKVHLSESERKLVTLRFISDPTASLTPETTSGSETKPAPAAATAPVDSRRGGFRAAPPIGSYLAWVIGAGAIGAGIGMGVHSIGLGNQLDDICMGSRTNCRKDVYELSTTQKVESDRRTFEILSVVGYGVGGAAILTGFAIWAFHPAPTPIAKNDHFEVHPIIGMGRLDLVGTF